MVCTVQTQKEYHNHTRITIGVNHICYPGNVGTPTASLELLKIIFSIFLSQPGESYSTSDIKNFYFVTLLDQPEYVKIRLSNIPQEFMDEYDLENCTQYGWVYFEIRKGVYGMPQ